MKTEIPAWMDGKLQPVDKLEVHRRGLKHPAVSVFVMQGDRVLLQRRALQKYHTPGLWANTCCTHPHWGEPPEACAVRRLREELGIDSVHLLPRGKVEYRAEVGGGLTEHEVVDIFRADSTDELNVTPNPAEVMDVRWMALSELARDIALTPDIYTPWLRIYLADHAQAIFSASTQSATGQ